MRDHERAMLAYARLAQISHQKRQLPGRDKFLVLTGAAACRAGWPEVALRCRELVLHHNRMHMVSRFDTFADALRSPDFEPLLKRLERMCGYEKAEHLLAELEIDPGVPPDQDDTVGQFALSLLGESP